MAVNASTGVISGTPTASYSQAAVVFRATDAAGRYGTTSVSFQVVQPISLVVAPLETVVGGTVALSTSGGLSPVSVTVLSGGGTISASTFTASGTPGTVVIQASESLGSLTQATVTVNAALALTPATKTLAVTGTQSLTVSGGVAPRSFTLVSGSGSVNVSSGVYTASGSSGTDVVRVTDSLGNQAQATLTVVTLPGIAPLGATLVVGGTASFAGNGGLAPYSFTLASGSGSVNASSGAYTAPGSSGTDVVRVTDSLGNQAQATLLVVTLPGISPLGTTLAVGNSASFAGNGGLAPYSFTLVSGSGSINTSNGAYTAPGSSGTDVVRVTDGLGNYAQATVTINPALAISPGGTTAKSNSSITFAANGGVLPYSYSLTSGNGSVSSATGVYTQNVNAGYAVVRVTDSLGNTSSANVTIIPDYHTSNLLARYDASMYDGSAFPATGCANTTWTDLQGAYNGALTNFASCGSTTGWNGTGSSADSYRLTFDGTNDTVATSARVDYPTYNQATLDFWVNPTRLNYGTRQWIAANGNNTSYNRGAYILENSATLVVGLNNNTNWNTGVTLAASTWQHVSVVYENSDAKVYVNGVPVSRGYATGTTSSTYGLLIGNSQFNSQYFKGEIANFSVFTTALTAAEVNKNCNAHKGRFSGASCASVDIQPRNQSVYSTKSITLVPSQGLQPFSFSVVSGGGSVDSASGVYTAPSGTATPIVRVSDAWGATVDVTLSVAPDSQTATNLVGRWDPAFATSEGGFPVYSRCTYPKIRDLAGSNDASLTNCSGGGFTGNGTSASVFSFTLDGTDDRLATSLRTDQPTYASATYEAWLYPTRVSHTARQWFFANSNNTAYGRGLFLLENTDQLVAGVNNTAPYWNSGLTLTSDQWVHLAVVYDATDVKVFKNGFVSSAGAVWGTTSSTYGLTIGSIATGGNYTQGKIGQVAVYSSALKPSEIAANCQALKARYDSTIVCGQAEIGAKAPWVYANASFTLNPAQGQTPYSFSRVSGGGSINSTTGAFTAPEGPDSTVVRLTDSLGYTSDATITTESDSVTSSSLVARWDPARATDLRSFPTFKGCVAPSLRDWWGGYSGTLVNCGDGTSGFQGTGTQADPYRMTFDGSNDYVTTALDVDYGAMNTGSIEAWIYPTRVNYGTQQWIIANSTNTLNSRGFSIKASASTINVGVNNNTAWDTGAGITGNAWNHVVVVYEASDVKVYVNGTATSRGSTVGTNTVTSTLLFGSISGGGNYFQGSIGYSAVYNKPLSQAEVTANCNANKARFGGITCN